MSSYIYLYIAMNADHKTPLFGSASTDAIINSMELVYVIDICAKFCLAYTPIGKTVSIRELSKTSKHYLETRFIWDLIPTIPLQLLNLNHHFHYKLLLIKVMRLKRGLEVFDVSSIIKYVSKRHFKIIIERVKDNEEL